ncbi:RAI1 like PD-XK nuclease-domain-containing protein [Dichotomocladium elegans]|nr:RAI1 like PD-XK nuclease-domain-containing protein [Dichotomocladium elegans]
MDCYSYRSLFAVLPTYYRMSKRPQSDYGDSPEAKRPMTFSTFPVSSCQSYMGHCPEYKQPVEIQSYSIDGSRRVWFDQRELKYYVPPNISPPGPSLNRGYEKYIKRDESVPEHLDTLLDALTTARQAEPEKNIAQANIVTWRGIMTKIFCTPYSRKEPWELCATRYNGSIYLEERTTEHKKQHEAAMSDRHKQMAYWGYRFESFCTATEPNGQPDPNDVPNTNIQYCVVVKTRLGRNTLLMGAEVDCIEGTKPEKQDPKNPLHQYIELKTSRRIDTQRQKDNFEKFKLLKFWAQSFLVGVPRVICGFRDDNGDLCGLETFKTMEIPRRVRDNTRAWNPSVCMNFADQFLNWLQKVVTEDDPTVTYTISWQEPWREIRLIRATGKEDVFLTQRYLDGKISHDIGGPRAHTPSGR